jgi:hypothetical protein
MILQIVTETRKLPILICEKSGLNKVQTGDISQTNCAKVKKSRRWGKIVPTRGGGNGGINKVNAAAALQAL